MYIKRYFSLILVDTMRVYQEVRQNPVPFIVSFAQLAWPGLAADEMDSLLPGSTGGAVLELHQ